MSPTVSTCDLQGPPQLVTRIFDDARALFFECWNQRHWTQLLTNHGQEPVALVQDSHSRSSHGVMCGLPKQLPPEPRGKLGRCLVGEIYDVVLDLHLSSLGFDRLLEARLRPENHQHMYEPVGFAYGFLSTVNLDACGITTAFGWCLIQRLKTRLKTILPWIFAILPERVHVLLQVAYDDPLLQASNTNTNSSHQNMRYNANFSLRLPLINRVLP
jgi:dTDP-4-dehydrorhamnose 3,5-epimerase